MAVPTPTRQSQTVEQTRRARLDKQLTAEREMVHSIIRGIVITTPIAVAALILGELQAEKRWQEVLSKDPGKLARLAAQALEDIRSGRTGELHLDDI